VAFVNDLYAVVEHNQASGQPDDQSVSFCDSLREAVEHADDLTEENRSRGRRERYLIYRLDEVDEDELFEWAIQAPDGSRRPIRFHEYAARRDCPAGHQVVKRRLGTTDWIPAPEEDN
jgi:hypothetical protein